MSKKNLGLLSQASAWKETGVQGNMPEPDELEDIGLLEPVGDPDLEKEDPEKEALEEEDLKEEAKKMPLSVAASLYAGCSFPVLLINLLNHQLASFILNFKSNHCFFAPRHYTFNNGKIHQLTAET